MQINQLSCRSSKCFTALGRILINIPTTTIVAFREFFSIYRDTLVPPEWGRRAFEELTKRGVEGDFTSLKNTLHELKKSELLELEKWLLEILPPLDGDLQNKL